VNRRDVSRLVDAAHKRQRTLQQLRNSYAYFDASEFSKTHMTRLFNVEPCEICGTELMAANPLVVNLSPGTLLANGFVEQAVPFDEGGWSELHSMATCTACCYDPDALTKHAIEQVLVCEVDAGIVDSGVTKP
jgi:hypothetical protein